MSNSTWRFLMVFLSIRHASLAGWNKYDPPLVTILEFIATSSKRLTPCRKCLMLERKVRYVEVHCVINKSINKTVGAITKNNKQLGLFFLII